MSNLNLESGPENERLAALFATDASVDLESLQYSIVDNTLVVTGAVNSYHQKLQVEQMARLAGFARVENALRVIPGLTP